ncbi:hypothetical protein GCM10029964_048030 [Kibdelosporangium lantanae]
MRSALAGVVMTLLAAVPGPPRQVLFDGGSSYPRVVRLASGRVLASITTNIGSDGAGVISASDDNGRTFQKIATIKDPAAAAGAGICCSTLYELPTPVGPLPAGTVLWVNTSGYTAGGSGRTRNRLWASADQGGHWRFLSDVAVSPNERNIWEPSLSVAADGRLVAFYSDETDKANHDQKLVQVRSSDGVKWTDYRETVVSTVWAVRPGMINAIRLPDRGYFMTYEVCNNDKLHLCSAYFRRSADGWNYGDPHDLGTLVVTGTGKRGRHTPVPAWSRAPAGAARSCSSPRCSSRKAARSTPATAAPSSPTTTTATAPGTSSRPRSTCPEWTTTAAATSARPSCPPETAARSSK